MSNSRRAVSLGCQVGLTYLRGLRAFRMAATELDPGSNARPGRLIVSADAHNQASYSVTARTTPNGSPVTDCAGSTNLGPRGHTGSRSESRTTNTALHPGRDSATATFPSIPLGIKALLRPLHDTGFPRMSRYSPSLSSQAWMRRGMAATSPGPSTTNPMWGELALAVTGIGGRVSPTATVRQE
jgi:hypothetical protein